MAAGERANTARAGIPRDPVAEPDVRTPKMVTQAGAGSVRRPPASMPAIAIAISRCPTSVSVTTVPRRHGLAPGQPGSAHRRATASMTAASTSRIQTGVSTMTLVSVAGRCRSRGSPASRPAPAGRAAARSWGRSRPGEDHPERLPDHPDHRGHHEGEHERRPGGRPGQVDPGGDEHAGRPPARSTRRGPGCRRPRRRRSRSRPASPARRAPGRRACRAAPAGPGSPGAARTRPGSATAPATARGRPARRPPGRR